MSDALQPPTVRGLRMTAAAVAVALRAHQRKKFAGWRWDDADVMRYLMLLAAEGVFWQDFFDLNPLPPEVRARIVALIERYAQHPELLGAPSAPSAPA